MAELIRVLTSDFEIFSFWFYSIEFLFLCVLEENKIVNSQHGAEFVCFKIFIISHSRVHWIAKTNVNNSPNWLLAYHRNLSYDTTLQKNIYEN